MAQGADVMEELERNWYQIFLPLWENYIKPWVWNPIIGWLDQQKNIILSEMNKAVDRLKSNLGDKMDEWWQGVRW